MTVNGDVKEVKVNSDMLRMISHLISIFPDSYD